VKILLLVGEILRGLFWGDEFKGEMSEDKNSIYLNSR
jgi:hypothetical protein